jgi:hypothetical protein
MEVVHDVAISKFRATATHSFVGGSPDELSFDGGDELAIFDDTGEWWLGEHLETGAFGLVPRNHLAPNFSDDSEGSDSCDGDGAAEALKDAAALLASAGSRASAVAAAIIASDSSAEAAFSSATTMIDFAVPADTRRRSSTRIG